MPRVILKYGTGQIVNVWNEDKPDEESEMMVYDDIGKDPWTGGGISSGDFRNALAELPTDRDCNCLVNSKGGDVHEGFTYQSDIFGWKNRTGRKFNVTYTGIAASTASWAFAGAADEVRAYENSQVFIHDALTFAMGNAAQLQKVVNDLDKTSDQIAGIYSDIAGKGKKKFRDMMKDETLLTANEAKDLGLVDVIVTGKKSVRNFTPQEITSMKDYLAVFRNSVAKRGGQQEKQMNKQRIINLLKKRGLTQWNGLAITEATSYEDLDAALASIENSIPANDPPPAPAPTPAPAAPAPVDPPAPTPAPANPGDLINQLQNRINRLEAAGTEARRGHVSNRIQTFINEDRLTEAERVTATARAIKDETYLDEIAARPVNRLGGQPVRAVAEITSNSFVDIQKYVLENSSGFMSNFIGARGAQNHERVSERDRKEIANRAIIAANTIRKQKKMIVEMFNTNVIESGLQRQVILQEMLEEFAIVLLPLTRFSAVFNNVPLEGTDEVDVPFYPLAVDAGNSWDPAVGYASNLVGDTETDTRPVVVGGSGSSSGAAAPIGTARDRKWIGAAFSSYELARQPYLNVQKLMIQKSNQLAVLIFKDIVSRVITIANYGASVKAIPPQQFDGNEVANLWETATGLNWPQRDRALVLNHTYLTPLLQDPTYKQYLSYGSTDPLRKAVISQAYNFDAIDTVPNLTNYSPAGENLVGWINNLYAMLVATSPIMPTPDVRALMTRYDIIVHPILGMTLEYRRFGDVTLDKTKEVVESSYGAAPGVQSALKRLSSQ